LVYERLLFRRKSVIGALAAIPEQLDKTGECPDKKHYYPQDKRAYQYQENDKAGAYFHNAPVSTYEW